MGRIPDTQLTYPTIAISDIFNCAAHAYGAYLAFSRDRMSAYGLGYVAVAAFAGVFRFGLSKRTFEPANEGWADAAAYIGLPLLGHRVLAPVLEGLGPIPAMCADEALYISVLLFASVIFQRYCRSADAQELSKVLVNLSFFALPLLYDGARTENHTLLAGVLLFVVGGVAIGNERERFILGMRRENVFHYFIGTAAYLIGAGIAGYSKLDQVPIPQMLKF